MPMSARRRDGWSRLAAMVPVLVVPVLLLVLAGCGSSGSPAAGATARPSGAAGAYADCLLKHVDGSGTGGARKACQKLKPAGGLGPVLQTFAACLESRGVALPSASPGTSAGDILRYLGQIRSGDPSQRAAFDACESRL